VTTYTATTALFLGSLHPALKSSLPGITRHLAAASFGMVNIQVLLGISTLLYLVPVPLAAAHQAGSVVFTHNYDSTPCKFEKTRACGTIMAQR